VDTEKVHSINHCHVDATNYANPINCCCDGPEGGRRKWVHLQGLKTNQGPSSAQTMMTHYLNKEASQIWRMAMQTQNPGRTPTAEIWRLTEYGTAEVRPIFQLTMKALEWESNSIYGKGPSLQDELPFLVSITPIIHIIPIMVFCIHSIDTASYPTHLGVRRRPAWSL
jgi:hypothetical protein